MKIILKNIGLLTVIFLSCIHANESALKPQNHIDTESFWKIYTNALRGDKIAQYQTGVMFERGIGTDTNESEASKWYEKSAIQGHMDAQYNLGLMYTRGQGIEQNEQLAMMWLATAAKQGDKEARKLLLALVDGGFDTKPMGKGDVKDDDSIVPITFTTKEGAQVCDSKGACQTYKLKTTLTSKRKRGNYYEISGIGTANGWKAYDKEGWIDEKDVNVK